MLLQLRAEARRVHVRVSTVSQRDSPLINILALIDLCMKSHVDNKGKKR